MESFEELLNSVDRESREGVHKGIVVRKTNDGILLDLNTKAEKFIPRSDFFNGEWEKLAVGDEIAVFLDEGKASFSKARRLTAMDELKAAQSARTPVTITVKKVVKGGFTASFSGIDVFVPLSLSGRARELAAGKDYVALVTRIDDAEDRVVCSVTDYENIQREQMFNELLVTLTVGARVEGTVKKIIDKGMFVDLSGVDAFVPFSEITHKRIKSPADVFSAGDRIAAQVIEVNNEKRKITLSAKALETAPWVRFIGQFKEGDTVEGTVRNTIKQGAFVELVDGLDGFVHVSEMSWTERVSDPSKLFRKGDRVSCVIKKIDGEKHKISLSFREIAANPWKEFIDNNEIGSVLTVTASQVSDRGVVVEVAGGLEGFIPNDHISWSKSDQAKQEIHTGVELTVKFIEGDPSRKRLLFSMKELSDDPWLAAAGTVKAGSEIEGVVTKIADKVVFLELLPHVEGIIIKNEFMRGRGELPEVRQGEKLAVLVKEVDLKKRRILLSHRDLVVKREQEDMEAVRSRNTAKVTLGDFFKRG